MKYALVNGQRREAEPDLDGVCPYCKRAMIAKCGNIRMKHWAHRGKRNCDSWWENETQWHRNWKEHFPIDWQEVVHTERGERHIADVKTVRGWVLEFQYSHLQPEERKARDTFYKKLVWIVYGSRLKRSRSQFFDALREETSNIESPFVRTVYRVDSTENLKVNSLLRDWVDTLAPVFFDFGQEDPTLWCLLPKTSAGNSYVVNFSRKAFIDLHRNTSTQLDDFGECLKGLKKLVAGVDCWLEAEKLIQIERQRQNPIPDSYFKMIERIGKSRRRV